MMDFVFKKRSYAWFSVDLMTAAQKITFLPPRRGQEDNFKNKDCLQTNRT